jgi:hypothetical protein
MAEISICFLDVAKEASEMNGTAIIVIKRLRYISFG